MFITLLYISAFMFFVAGRRLRRAFIPGIAMIFMASLPLSYKTLYYGYLTLKFAGQFLPDIDKYSGNAVSLIFALAVSLLITGILMLPAKLWGRELFMVPKDDLSSRKTAKRIFISAAVIPGVVAIWLYSFKSVAHGINNANFTEFCQKVLDDIGINFFFIEPVRYLNSHQHLELIKAVNTAYVLLLLAISVLCIVLAGRKFFAFKDAQGSLQGEGSALPAVALIISLSGVLAFLTTAQNGHIYWSSHYRRASFSSAFYYSTIYGSYNKITGKFYSTALFTFCMIVLGVMAAGIVILLISLIYMAARKLICKNLFTFIFSIAMIVISSACIYRMLIEIARFHSIGR